MKRRTAKSHRKRDYVLVFGAAVRPNGRPSAALRRRISSAAAWAQQHPRSIVVPTGAAGEYGPAEARVVKEALLAEGVSSSRIVMELEGRDTLQSVQLCHKLIQRRGDCDRIVCCTSRYHQPRCALLLRLLGYRVVLPKIPIRRGRLSGLALTRLYVRELAALPFDSFLLSASRVAP
jgi:uncharacterized SAM-binding protein YcdF (DUF218 family)